MHPTEIFLRLIRHSPDGPPATRRCNSALPVPTERNAILTGAAGAIGMLWSVAALAQSTPSPSFARLCETSLPPAAVTITALTGDFTLQNDVSVADLTTRSGETRPGRHTAGLTEHAFQYRAALHSTSISEPASPMTCARMQVEATIDTRRQVVTIAREFHPHECAFDEIVRHETRHVQANRDYAARVAAQTQEEMIVAYRDRIFYGTREQIAQTMLGELNTRWIPAMRDRMKAVSAEQRKIDTTAEYERMYAICHGEIMRTVGAGRPAANPAEPAQPPRRPQR